LVPLADSKGEGTCGPIRAGGRGYARRACLGGNDGPLPPDLVPRSAGTFPPRCAPGDQAFGDSHQVGPEALADSLGVIGVAGFDGYGDLDFAKGHGETLPVVVDLDHVPTLLGDDR